MEVASTFKMIFYLLWINTDYNLWIEPWQLSLMCNCVSVARVTDQLLMQGATLHWWSPSRGQTAARLLARRSALLFKHFRAHPLGKANWPYPLIAPQAPSALVAGAKGPQGSCQSNPKEVARRINGLRRLLGQLYHLSLATLVPPPIHCRIQDSYSEFAQRRPSNA